FVNVGTGEDLTIKELALMIKDIVGYKGEIRTDLSKPDGTPRKLLDISKIRDMGWMYRIDLRSGIENTYAEYIKHT
ncbi:MAG: GDP-L-fucose synthase, partial [candidate division WOR-3 bacterium]|nr:GDP-L-fucose synthase [candidate division WOR-3 bacterium]